MKTYLFNFGSVYFVVEAFTIWTAVRKAKEKHGPRVRLVDFGPVQKPIEAGCEYCKIYLSKCFCDARGS